MSDTPYRYLSATPVLASLDIQRSVDFYVRTLGATAVHAQAGSYGIVALGDVEEAEPYDEEKDFALWNGAASAALVLGEGRFAVFMVEEPHKPAIKAQGCDKVKKAVFKIAY